MSNTNHYQLLDRVRVLLLDHPNHPKRTCLIRAYAIGYATEVIPSIVKLIIIKAILFTRTTPSPTSFLRLVPNILLHVIRSFLRGLRPTGLATASAIAIGGARFLQERLIHHMEIFIRLIKIPHERFLRLIAYPSSSPKDNTPLSEIEQLAAAVLSTFSAASLSSLAAIMVLQSKHTSAMMTQDPLHPTMTPYPTFNDPDHSLLRPNRQSPTLDFTLFFTVRALDTLCRSIYDNFSPHWLSFLSRCADTLLFQLCCWRIMWCWFYKPKKLPTSYVKWISTLAEMDQRLLQLIRLAKEGKFVYGTKPKSDHIKALGRSIAIRMGKPPQDGDPEFIKQLSCQIVHGTLGNSKSCTTNVFRRWCKAWKTSLGIYFPVFTVPVLLFQRKKIMKSPLRTTSRILINSSRSAAFLSSFVGLTWTGVCLGRSTRLQDILNKLIAMRLDGSSSSRGEGRVLTTTDMDSTVAPQLGSFLAGFSILIENKNRRGEMALYVATRALCATVDEILPNWLRHEIQLNRWVSIWVERFTFSFSIGIITCAIVHHPDYVRGIVKGILKYAVGNDWPTRYQLLTRPSSPPPDPMKNIPEDQQT